MLPVLKPVSPPPEFRVTVATVLVVKVSFPLLARFAVVVNMLLMVPSVSLAPSTRKPEPAL